MNRELKGREPVLKNDICERTFDFSVRIVKLCRLLDEQTGVSRTLSKQLIRSGTSIGANVEEAQGGQSRADFLSKISIACKEARETLYWLKLLEAAVVIPDDRLKEIRAEADLQLSPVWVQLKLEASNPFRGQYI